MRIISLFIFEMEEFYNTGFGWICKRCEREISESTTTNETNLPRMWREGESESKQPTLSAPIAKWFDKTRRTLICPRCGVTEVLDKS